MTVFVARCSHGNDRNMNVIGIDKDDETCLALKGYFAETPTDMSV
jgi:hypothetical protein